MGEWMSHQTVKNIRETSQDPEQLKNRLDLGISQVELPKHNGTLSVWWDQPTEAAGWSCPTGCSYPAAANCCPWMMTPPQRQAPTTPQQKIIPMWDRRALGRGNPPALWGVNRSWDLSGVHRRCGEDGGCLCLPFSFLLIGFYDTWGSQYKGSFNPPRRQSMVSRKTRARDGWREEPNPPGHAVSVTLPILFPKQFWWTIIKSCIWATASDFPGCEGGGIREIIRQNHLCYLIESKYLPYVNGIYRILRGNITGIRGAVPMNAQQAPVVIQLEEPSWSS